MLGSRQCKRKEIKKKESNKEIQIRTNEWMNVVIPMWPMEGNNAFKSADRAGRMTSWESEISAKNVLIWITVNSTWTATWPTRVSSTGWRSPPLQNSNACVLEWKERRRLSGGGSGMFKQQSCKETYTEMDKTDTSSHNEINYLMESI